MFSDESKNVESTESDEYNVSDDVIKHIVYTSPQMICDSTSEDGNEEDTSIERSVPNTDLDLRPPNSNLFSMLRNSTLVQMVAVPSMFGLDKSVALEDKSSTTNITSPKPQVPLAEYANTKKVISVPQKRTSVDLKLSCDIKETPQRNRSKSMQTYSSIERLIKEKETEKNSKKRDIQRSNSTNIVLHSNKTKIIQRKVSFSTVKEERKMSQSNIVEENDKSGKKAINHDKEMPMANGIQDEQKESMEADDESYKEQEKTIAIEKEIQDGSKENMSSNDEDKQQPMDTITTESDEIGSIIDDVNVQNSDDIDVSAIVGEGENNEGKETSELIFEENKEVDCNIENKSTTTLEVGDVTEKEIDITENEVTEMPIHETSQEELNEGNFTENSVTIDGISETHFITQSKNEEIIEQQSMSLDETSTQPVLQSNIEHHNEVNEDAIISNEEFREFDDDKEIKKILIEDVNEEKTEEENIEEVINHVETGYQRTPEVEKSVTETVITKDNDGNNKSNAVEIDDNVELDENQTEYMFEKEIPREGKKVKYQATELINLQYEPETNKEEEIRKEEIINVRRNEDTFETPEDEDLALNEKLRETTIKLDDGNIEESIKNNTEMEIVRKYNVEEKGEVDKLENEDQKLTDDEKFNPGNPVEENTSHIPTSQEEVRISSEEDNTKRNDIIMMNVIQFDKGNEVQVESSYVKDITVEEDETLDVKGEVYDQFKMIESENKGKEDSKILLNGKEDNNDNINNIKDENETENIVNQELNKNNITIVADKDQCEVIEPEEKYEAPPEQGIERNKEDNILVKENIIKLSTGGELERSDDVISSEAQNEVHQNFKTELITVEDSMNENVSIVELSESKNREKENDDKQDQENGVLERTDIDISSDNKEQKVELSEIDDQKNLETELIIVEDPMKENFNIVESSESKNGEKENDDKQDQENGVLERTNIDISSDNKEQNVEHSEIDDKENLETELIIVEDPMKENFTIVESSESKNGEKENDDKQDQENGVLQRTDIDISSDNKEQKVKRSEIDDKEDVNFRVSSLEEIPNVNDLIEKKEIIELGTTKEILAEGIKDLNGTKNEDINVNESPVMEPGIEMDVSEIKSSLIEIKSEEQVENEDSNRLGKGDLLLKNDKISVHDSDINDGVSSKNVTENSTDIIDGDITSSSKNKEIFQTEVEGQKISISEKPKKKQGKVSSPSLRLISSSTKQSERDEQVNSEIKSIKKKPIDQTKKIKTYPKLEQEMPKRLSLVSLERPKKVPLTRKISDMTPQRNIKRLSLGSVEMVSEEDTTNEPKIIEGVQKNEEIETDNIIKPEVTCEKEISTATPFYQGEKDMKKPKVVEVQSMVSLNEGDLLTKVKRRLSLMDEPTIKESLIATNRPKVFKRYSSLKEMSIDRTIISPPNARSKDEKLSNNIIHEDSGEHNNDISTNEEADDTRNNLEDNLVAEDLLNQINEEVIKGEETEHNNDREIQEEKIVNETKVLEENIKETMEDDKIVNKDVEMTKEKSEEIKLIESDKEVENIIIYDDEKRISNEIFNEEIKDLDDRDSARFKYDNKVVEKANSDIINDKDKEADKTMTINGDIQQTDDSNLQELDSKRPWVIDSWVCDADMKSGDEDLKPHEKLSEENIDNISIGSKESHTSEDLKVVLKKKISTTSYKAMPVENYLTTHKPKPIPEISDERKPIKRSKKKDTFILNKKENNGKKNEKDENIDSAKEKEIEIITLKDRSKHRQKSTKKTEKRVKTAPAESREPEKLVASNESEFRRIKSNIDEMKIKIQKNKKERKEFVPYLFNNLQPYGDTNMYEVTRQHSPRTFTASMSRITAIELCDPWENHRMDRLALPPIKDSTQQFLTSRSQPKSHRKGDDPIASQPVTSLNQYDTDARRKSSKSANYSHRSHSHGDRSRMSSRRIEDDYQRTRTELYRLSLDKLNKTNTRSGQANIRSALFAYLQNSPGSKKALYEVIRHNDRIKSGAT